MNEDYIFHETVILRIQKIIVFLVSQAFKRCTTRLKEYEIYFYARKYLYSKRLKRGGESRKTDLDTILVTNLNKEIKPEEYMLV